MVTLPVIDLWVCIRWGHVSLDVRLSSSPSGQGGGSPPITRPSGTAPTHCLDRTHCRQSIIQRASLHTTSRRYRTENDRKACQSLVFFGNKYFFPNRSESVLTRDRSVTLLSCSRASCTSLVSSASRSACWARWVSSSSLTQAWQYWQRKSRS